MVYQTEPTGERNQSAHARKLCGYAGSAIHPAPSLSLVLLPPLTGSELKTGSVAEVNRGDYKPYPPKRILTAEIKKARLVTGLFDIRF